MGNTTVNVPSNSNKCRHQFDSLSVIMDKGAGADIRNKDDQRAIRLKFEVSFTINGQRTVSSVLSQPVFNAKLIINKISHAHGPANGGTEVIILCSKIRKSTTAVRIRDVNWTPGNASEPLAECIFMLAVFQVHGSLPTTAGPCRATCQPTTSRAKSWARTFSWRCI